MKKNKYISFMIFSIILVLAGCSNNKMSNTVNVSSKEKIAMNSLGTTGSIGKFKELKVNVNTTKLPKNIKVYKVKKANLNKDKIKDLALKLDIKGPLTEDNENLIVTGDKANLYVNKNTGSYKYFTKELMGQFGENPLKTILSDSEYIKLAEDFLNKNNIAKPDMVCKGVNRGYTLETVDNDGKSKKDIYRVEVKFESPSIDNMIYTGVGPKISVWFGDNGKIIGYASIWREIEKLKEYPRLSIDEAVKNVKNNKKSLLYNVDQPDEEGTINSVEIALWSDPEGYIQEYVTPHYIFKGKKKDGTDFTAVTRAISDEYISEKGYKETSDENILLDKYKPEITEKE